MLFRHWILIQPNTLPKLILPYNIFLTSWQLACLITSSWNFMWSLSTKKLSAPRLNGEEIDLDVEGRNPWADSTEKRLNPANRWIDASYPKVKIKWKFTGALCLVGRWLRQRRCWMEASSRALLYRSPPEWSLTRYTHWEKRGIWAGGLGDPVTQATLKLH